MTKTLQKYGNSHALVIDKALMDATGITPDTQLTVTVSGNSITITPASVGVGPQKVAESMDFINKNYAEAMKRLAQ
jgi:antitoxin component of MazEF toxin-antitoxin module